MSDKRGGGKAAIAAEAWGALLDLTMGQRNRFFGILRELSLPPATCARFRPRPGTPDDPALHPVG